MRPSVLVEAGRVGRGSTAASTALPMQEPDKDFAELAKQMRFGLRASPVANGARSDDHALFAFDRAPR